MGDTQKYVVMCTDSHTGKVFYIDAEHKSSATAPSGYQVCIPISPTAWNSMVYQDKKDCRGFSSAFLTDSPHPSHLYLALWPC